MKSTFIDARNFAGRFADRYRLPLLLEWFAHASFVFFLLTELLASHSRWNQFSIVLLCFAGMLFCCLRFRVRTSWYFFFSCLFILVAVINVRTGASINPVTSGKMIRTLISNLLILFAVYQYFTLCRSVRRVLLSYVAAALLGSLYTLVICRTAIFSFRLGIVDDVMYVNCNSLGLMTAIATVILANEFLLAMKRSLWMILPCAFLLWITVLTGSRKALIVVAIGWFGVLAFRRLKYLPLYVAGLAVLGVLAYFILTRIPALYQVMGRRVESLLLYLIGRNAEEDSLSSRLDYFRLGRSYFLYKPWRGYGIDCFRHLEGSYGTYSHNNYIELLFGLGIPGAVAYYLSHLTILVSSFISVLRRRPYGAFCLSMILTIFMTDYALVCYYSRAELILPLLLFALLRQDREAALHSTKSASIDTVSASCAAPLR